MRTYFGLPSFFSVLSDPVLMAIRDLSAQGQVVTVSKSLPSRGRTLWERPDIASVYRPGSEYEIIPHLLAEDRVWTSQTGGRTEKQTGGQTGRQTGRQAEKQISGQTEKNRSANRQTDRRTDRQTGGQTEKNRPADRQKYRPAYRQAERHTRYMHPTACTVQGMRSSASVLTRQIGGQRDIQTCRQTGRQAEEHKDRVPDIIQTGYIHPVTCLDQSMQSFRMF